MATVRTRKRGKTYSYIFEAGRTADGKRKVVEKGGFPSKQSAYDAGLDAYNKFQHGGIRAGKKIRLADYLTEWLTVRRADLRPATIAQYESCIKRSADYFAGAYLQDIRPRDIAGFLDSLYNHGLSKSSIKTHRAILHAALRYAVYPAELILANPADAIPLPRKAPDRIVSRDVIDQERFRAIIAAADRERGEYFVCLLTVLYRTGLRLGEALGLTWDCIDFDEKALTVKQQLSRSPSAHLAPPKTKSSVRTFYLDDITLAALRRRKHQQTTDQIARGSAYIRQTHRDGKVVQGSSVFVKNPIPFVFTKPSGRLVHHRQVWNFLCKHGTNPHSFRHTHATRLIELGATAKDVAARLGHASTAITEDLYTHDTETMMRATVALLNADK